MLKYALVFSGQGSEKIGMFNNFINEIPEFSSMLEEIKENFNVDLKNVILSNDILQIKSHNQLLLLMFHYFISREIILRIGYKPSICLGHSFGQFSALVNCGAIDFNSMLNFIQMRTKIINNPKIANRAKFKSIHGLSLSEFEEIVGNVKSCENIKLALHNQKEQIVIATTLEGEENINRLSLKNKFIIKDMNISRPYHTSYMKEYNDELLEEIKKISVSKPSYPIFLNNGVISSIDEIQIYEEMKIQMIKPVYWYDSILNVSESVDAFIIIDPSDMHYKIIRRISDKKIYNISNLTASRRFKRREV